MANNSKEKYLRRGVVGVISHNGRILVIQRSAYVSAPLKWCLPGGGVERGETEEEALQREMMEELNLHVVPIKKVYESTTRRKMALSWWTVDIEAQELKNLKPEPLEVRDVRWMTPEELRKHPGTLQSNVEALRFLEDNADSQKDKGEEGEPA
ncbi:MAG: NUDIX domain-containing protein [Planctomycetia bacterium]|nr:NUDIX domain-containing protein [Planctomycetia bacterium]